VADTMEALGRHMQQEAPDELVQMKPHRLSARRTVGAVVLPAERNAGFIAAMWRRFEMATRCV
jgi:hypothetical protein